MLKNKLGLLYVCMISLFLFSCGNKHCEHHVAEESREDVLALDNNGNKWLVNEEMKPFVEEGEDILNAYLSNGMNDYKTLAVQLKEQNSLLIKSCTMEGTAHDELHKWLYPHLALVKNLENAESSEDATAIIRNIKASYETYRHFFN